MNKTAMGLDMTTTKRDRAAAAAFFNDNVPEVI